LAVRAVAIIDNFKGAGGNVTGWWGNFRTFLTEVRNELKRVTWPSRKEVYATTLVVILTSIFFGLYLFALDGVFNIGIQWVFKQFGVA
jgi:preprotein translocase subunit SecE